MSAYQDYFDPHHQLIRDSVRRFVEREILPGIEHWEEAQIFPRDLYDRAGAAGILGIGYPESLGGSHEGDLFAKVAASEELMRCGSGGVVAGLGSLDIGLPPVVKWARPEVRERVVPQVLAGAKVIALAVTEPGGGSDVANLHTRAVRDGDCYRVSGSKTFIYQRRARRLLHRGGAHRWAGICRYQPAVDRKKHPWFYRRSTTEEDGLVGVGHG